MLRHPLFASLVFALTLALGGCASEVGNDGAKVGGSCVVSGECTNDSVCRTGEDWPGGYCAQGCDTNEDCADGALCSELEGGICIVECGATGDCRSSEDDGGYACSELDVRGAAGTFTGCVAE